MAFTLSTKQREFIPEWNGNKESEQPIKMILGRLTVGDFWELVPLNQQLAKMAQDFANADPVKISDIFKKLKPLFEKYVHSLENIWIDEKKVSPADIVDQIEFAPLMMEISTELIMRAQLSDQSKKNSLKKFSQSDQSQTSLDGSNSTEFAISGSQIGSK